jgi:uncharacterized membrane protein
VLAAVLLGASCWAWPRQPVGQVNYFALFMAPGLVLGFAALYRLIPYQEPRGANLPVDRSFHLGLHLLILICAASFHYVMIRVSLGHPLRSGLSLIWGGMGALAIVLGNQLGKCRINSRFRVRNPWTMCSELAWNRTNRLAGWMVVIFGLILILAALVQFAGIRVSDKGILIFQISYTAVWLITIHAYAYFLWRNDPAKTGFCPLGSKKSAE